MSSEEATPIPSPQRFSRISAATASGVSTTSLKPLLTRMTQYNNEDEEEEDQIMQANEEPKSSVMLMIVLERDFIWESCAFYIKPTFTWNVSLGQ
jgi:hypothetical protein